MLPGCVYQEKSPCSWELGRDSGDSWCVRNTICAFGQSRLPPRPSARHTPTTPTPTMAQGCKVCVMGVGGSGNKAAASQVSVPLSPGEIF